MPSARENARQARLERHRRVGIPASQVFALLPEDDAFAPPVTLGQSQGPATLVATIDDFGARIQGIIVKTGDSAFSTELSIDGEELTLRVISDSVTEIEETVALDTDGLQPQTYVVAIDPEEPVLVGVEDKKVIGARVWVDGRLHIAARGTTLADPEDVVANAWASSTEDWEYGQVTNAGTVRDLELHLRLPAVF